MCMAVGEIYCRLRFRSSGFNSLYTLSGFSYPGLRIPHAGLRKFSWTNDWSLQFLLEISKSDLLGGSRYLQCPGH